MVCHPISMRCEKIFGLGGCLVVCVLGFVFGLVAFSSSV
jgi:hypothetical protein